MDAILELLAAQVQTLSERIDAFGSQPIRNDCNWQQGSYNPEYFHSDLHYHPDYYHPDLQYHPDFSWSNNSQDQSFAPELSYPQEFLYQPPPPYEEESNLEELLTMFIEKNEAQMNSQEASIRNLENHLNQLINTVNNAPQWPLPSDSETYPMSDGEEQCEVIPSIDEEFCVDIGEGLERSQPSVVDDCDDGCSWNEIGNEEKMDEDDHAENSISVVQNPIVPLAPFLHPCPNVGEYFRVELIEDINLTEELPSNCKECSRVEVVKGTVEDWADDESYFLPMDEAKFKGGLQSCVHAKELKEKTSRRHAMTIFPYEPD